MSAASVQDRDFVPQRSSSHRSRSCRRRSTALSRRLDRRALNALQSQTNHNARKGNQSWENHRPLDRQLSHDAARRHLTRWLGRCAGVTALSYVLPSSITRTWCVSSSYHIHPLLHVPKPCPPTRSSSPLPATLPTCEYPAPARSSHLLTPSPPARLSALEHPWPSPLPAGV